MNKVTMTKTELKVEIIEPKPKSKLLVGDMTIYNTKHFNWLNRIMFKIFFGVTIKNIKEN